MGHRYQCGLDPVLGHEEPARESLLHVMEPVAGSRLGDLHAVDHGKTAERQEKIREGSEQASDVLARNSVSRPRDLDDLSKGASFDTKKALDTDDAFAANDA